MLYVFWQSIPQLIIQSLYLAHVGNSGSSNQELIVIFSIILSSLSLITSITRVSIVILQILIKYNVHVQQTAVIGVKLTLKCDNFLPKHQHTKKILTKSMLTTLRECNKSSLWVDRADVSMEVETFYVNHARMKANKEIDFYVDLTLTSYQSNLSQKDSVASVLTKTMKTFAKKEEFESKQFIKVM